MGVAEQLQAWNAAFFPIEEKVKISQVKISRKS